MTKYRLRAALDETVKFYTHTKSYTLLKDTPIELITDLHITDSAVMNAFDLKHYVVDLLLFMETEEDERVWQCSRTKVRLTVFQVKEQQ